MQMINNGICSWNFDGAVCVCVAENDRGNEEKRKKKTFPRRQKQTAKVRLGAVSNEHFTAFRNVRTNIDGLTVSQPKKIICQMCLPSIRL